MNKFIQILVVVLLFFSFWILWLPRERVATDYHKAEEGVQIDNIFPYIWRETSVADGLGEYTGISLWSQPLHIFSGLLAFLNLPFFIQTKLFILMILILGFVSINKLLNYIKIKKPASYISAFFYLTNTYFLLLIDGGQLSLGLVYAIFPLAVYFLLKATDLPSLLSKLQLTFAVLAISVLDIRFIYLLALIFLVQFIARLFSENRSTFLKQTVLTSALTLIILLGFHAYWLLPSFLKPPQLPQTYERASQVDFLSFSTIGHSLFLQQPHWYKNVFGQISNIRTEFILISILVFMAPILRRKDKVVGFWLIIAAVGIFLSKGSKEPFSQIYSWFFTNIPLFSLFRDPVKFYFLICLAYAVLLGFTFQGIASLKNKNYYVSQLIKIAPILIIIYFFWLMRPVFLGQMTGLFALPIYEKEYSQLSEAINSDKNFSRTFWIPTKNPLVPSNEVHPSLEASRMVQKRPFAIGSIGTYETFNFLRESSFMGEIFDVSGIGNIAYSYLDPRRDDMHPDSTKYFYTFSNQLSSLPWLSSVKNSPVPLWQTKKHQDRFFIAPNIWWVIGSDNIYKKSIQSDKLKLSKNALIFAEEKAGLGKRIDEVPEAIIVLNNKTKDDLAASFIDPDTLVFPAMELEFDPDESGWWKREGADLIIWRDFLQTKYGFDNQDFDLGGGWAIGEGELKLTVKNENLTKGQILLARVLESSRSGKLSFNQDDHLIGSINTKKEGSNIRWFEIGELINNDGQLNIQSSGDINVVNALAILNKSEWLMYLDKAAKFQKDGKIIDFDEGFSKVDLVNVSYKKVNPTKYIVRVTNLNEPAILVFSQNFDVLWKLDGQQALPIYSLLNGFRIDKNGEYLVEFEAQKFVYYGLIISGLTILLILFLLSSARSKS